MNYTSVERHLEALREMGLLREKRYGKIRIYEALFRTISVKFERNRGVRVETEVATRF
jgi:DNA-binding transcriptional ArsR family regulator